MCELHLCTTFDGVIEPIDIVAILDKELLVVENLAYQSVTMLDENNLPIEVTSIANQYALIKKRTIGTPCQTIILFNPSGFNSKTVLTAL